MPSASASVDVMSSAPELVTVTGPVEVNSSPNASSGRSTVMSEVLVIVTPGASCGVAAADCDETLEGSVPSVTRVRSTTGGAAVVAMSAQWLETLADAAQFPA